MSIEKKIEDLIDALDRNTEAWSALKAAATPAQIAAPPAKAEKPKAVAKPEPKKEPVKETVASGPTAADVEARIDSMLKANKRQEAITLLASFNGAKSKTGIIEQGAEVIAAFVEGADEILLSA